MDGSDEVKVFSGLAVRFETTIFHSGPHVVAQCFGDILGIELDDHFYDAVVSSSPLRRTESSTGMKSSHGLQSLEQGFEFTTGTGLRV